MVMDVRKEAISIIYKESNRKLAAEVDALKKELAAFTESHEQGISQLHEVIKENAALRGLVRKLGKLMELIFANEICLCPTDSRNCYITKIAVVLSRPEVREIMEDDLIV
jgi:hypothetical protein